MPRTCFPQLRKGQWVLTTGPSLTTSNRTIERANTQELLVYWKEAMLVYIPHEVAYYAIDWITVGGLEAHLVRGIRKYPYVCKLVLIWILILCVYVVETIFGLFLLASGEMLIEVREVLNLNAENQCQQKNKDRWGIFYKWGLKNWKSWWWRGWQEKPAYELLASWGAAAVYWLRVV